MRTATFKTCSKCSEEKSLDQFYRDRTRSDGYRYRCKLCENENQKSKYNPNQRRKYNHSETGYKSWRECNLKKFYGITLEDYNRMFAEQNGCCAMCGRHQSEFKRRLAVDHDHKTSKVRGLLCTGCNVKLGVLEDRDLVELSKVYLSNFV